MKGFLCVALISLLAIGQSAATFEEDDAVIGRSIIDPIIKNILEGLRPKLANLTLPDIEKSIENPNLNATVSVCNMEVVNADKFVIKVLKSNLLPLRLANLTLFWDKFNVAASYDVNATVRVPQIRDPITLFASGDASANVNGVFFTIGANMEMKNKAIQVKPRGLFGFDLRVRRINVTVESILGSEELGQIVGNFLSGVIPNLIDDVKFPIFDALQDDIIKGINDVLRKNGTFVFGDEEFPLEEQQEQEEQEQEDEEGIQKFFLNLFKQYDNSEESFESEEEEQQEQEEEEEEEQQYEF